MADYELHYVLNCPCGEQLTGDTEDDIVAVASAHLAEKHPGRDYQREDILFMAQRLVKGKVTYRVTCPCGAELKGDDEDGIVFSVNLHLKMSHGGQAGPYSKEQILGMARKVTA